MLTPKDYEFAVAWYDSLKRTESVHLLTSDIVSPMAQHRDKRQNPEWYEKDKVLAGTRFVVVYEAPDRDFRELFLERLKLATKLEDVRVLTHVRVRRAHRRGEMRWIVIRTPVAETLEFRFECEDDRVLPHMGRREKAYAFAQRDMAHLLLRWLSNKPEEGLDALFATSAVEYLSAHRLAERLLAMGVVTEASIRFAVQDANFPNETDDE